MQLAGRLYSAWSLIRDRLHHRNLVIILLLHVTTSAILFILSILSLETNAEASHLLRDIIQTANLSSSVFYNPDQRKTGDWRNAPALIVTGNDTISTKKEDGIICSDDGKKCRAVGKALQREPFIPDNDNLSSKPFKPTTQAVTTTMTSRGSIFTTRVFLVPTLTVVQGEAITTQVMLNEEGSIIEAQTNSYSPPPTASIISSMLTTSTTTTSSSATTVTIPSAKASPKTLAEEDEDEEDEEKEHGKEHGSDDGSDDSDDSDLSDDDDEVEEVPKVLRESKMSYIQDWKRDIQISAVGGSEGVIGVNIAQSGKTDMINIQCATHYGWAINSLDNLVREESVLATFFIWILGLAIVWILNESIPHLSDHHLNIRSPIRFALLLSLLISSVWTAIDLQISMKFWKNFQSTTVNYCEGVNVLPMYLSKRIGFQSSVLGLSIITLFASGVLCWKIRDHFGWQTFQRIGASSRINRIYKLVLALSILLQLDAFVLVTFFALFLEQISRGPASYFMRNCKAYKAIYSLLIVVLLPWLYLGWTSVRKEQKRRFNMFIGLSLCIIGGWVVSFANDIFRITFGTWTFFTAMGSLALALTVITLVLAIIRRFTFGKGLAEYLYFEEVEERLTLGFDEKPSMPIAMPRNDLPTFSTAFGPGPAPPPRQMFPPMPVYLTATRVSSAPSWRAGDDSRL